MPEPARQPISQDGDLLTAEDVAALLRVTPAWVYAETRRHRIPHIRLGRYVRYRRDALVLWMDQLERRSNVAIGRRGTRLNDAVAVRLGGPDGSRPR
jgi:excisionase family DNA binding protein